MNAALLQEYGRSAWEFAWAYTGRTDASTEALSMAFRTLTEDRLPAQEPARRRAFWRAVADACRQQASARRPGSPESGDPRLSRILDLPLELREVLLLLRFQAASAEDLGVILGCPPEVALARARRALGRIALADAMPPP